MPTPGFARLQREWYARIKAEGFDDIEYGDGSLKVACRENRGIDPLEYESTLEYYSRAAAFLDGHEWPTPMHREVWRLHAEGATLREIGTAHGRSVKWAHGIVTSLRRTMMAWGGKPESPDAPREALHRRQRRAWRRAWGEQMKLPF